jgi:hypothetical protein
MLQDTILMTLTGNQSPHQNPYPQTNQHGNVEQECNFDSACTTQSISITSSCTMSPIDVKMFERRDPRDRSATAQNWVWSDASLFEGRGFESRGGQSLVKAKNPGGCSPAREDDCLCLTQTLARTEQPGPQVVTRIGLGKPA